MTETELRRTVRKIVVEELTLLAKALGGQSAANSYAIDAFRADQDREASSAVPEPKQMVRRWKAG